MLSIRYNSAKSIGINLSFRRTFFLFNYFGQKIIYPPDVKNITTENRLFPTYIESNNELHNHLLFKYPLILNFTYPGDKNCNKLTKPLFDVLSDSKKYPSNSPAVGLVNISCDTEGGRDIMSTYAINKVPTLLLLQKQMPTDKFQPNLDTFKESDLIEWIKSI
ncbi:hypothetical protein HYPBUDRAFT_140547 [Hyphopichia burtonii NRRL Y-1933]|uniref:Thioredoxin domain-containing protein n=1 Tax=Hyphopichia burtonii NRRL Y-1933 TaxID=984485 RepID=A0A1E4RGE6_9ASCO|nr:hypothetical protein HYPBUDRAFT_140547 [Hyphopichia burtonii NRRL Y-1933]ODV66342.1 hypothetical protein HYPBUDRAFT_140547 [Hyphopichia burtonii NRRL Y-1933]